MAYRIKAGESIPEAIHRILGEEADFAIEQLTRCPKDKRDEAIHEARKSIKKIRGLLHLVQTQLGSVYGEENRRLRDTGRRLSSLRDASAIIEVFDSVLDKHKTGIDRGALGSIRKGLEKDKRGVEQAADIEKLMNNAASSLRSLAKRMGNWPLSGSGFKIIARDIENTYRRGRKALATAQATGAPEDYHYWRRRTKDHWYQMRLLENLWTNVMQAHEASLKDLQSWLGDDHNLVVLREHLQKEPEKYGDEQSIQLFIALAEQDQRELREKCLSLGQRIYRQKPRQFTNDMAKLWKAWQDQPPSMKDATKKQPQRATGSTQRKPAVA